MVGLPAGVIIPARYEYLLYVKGLDVTGSFKPDEQLSRNEDFGRPLFA